MLSRVLEPEVMDTATDAADYDAMDHTHVNGVFVDDLLRVWPVTATPCRVFDAGTGTAQIPIELLRRGVNAQIIAADAAAEMLQIARKNIDAAGFASSVRCVECDCKWLSDPDASYNVVMSNSIIHHIPQPAEVFEECWRILKPGGVFFFRDLHRPRDIAEWDRLVETYAGSANAHQRQLFRDSLRAALTVEEVCEMIRPLGLGPDCVQLTSDRHWTLSAQKPIPL
ncbi:MAG TPA: methyltransferase domain-containing protein [Planctomycetaceae bacterium]|nr:methyltransferase domain-containing protein [Planctomycetaceae bacterium]